MAVFTYLERVADNSPASGNINQDGASTTAPYKLALESATAALRYTELQNTIVDVLGSTDTRVTDGRINRRLPLRHPLYSWMYADSISHQGVGANFDMVTPTAAPGSALINQQVPIYRTYEVQIPCSPRPYNTWQNQDVYLINSSFYYKDGTSKDFTYATEWWRFAEWINQPRTDFITAQQGMMKFRVQGGGDPNNFTFQDSPRLFLPDSTVVVNWYGVPYRYITSPRSYLTRFVGYVNQLAIGPSPTAPPAQPQYPPGSLLFQGACPLRIYTNPVPNEGLLAFNYDSGFDRARLCDLQLTFSYTPRVVTGTVPTASNLNWIYAGWNLFAWLTDRTYRLATTWSGILDLPATWVPMYLSLPFELLFTDPDLLQPFGSIEP